MKCVSRPLADEAVPPQRDNDNWLLHSEKLWRQAHAIVRENPNLDAGDVYHSLQFLELPAGERLRRGLTRVRARPNTR